MDIPTRPCHCCTDGSYYPGGGMATAPCLNCDGTQRVASGGDRDPRSNTFIQPRYREDARLVATRRVV